MSANEKKILFDRYMEMPEGELTEMLAVDESEYKEGVFPLLIEAAKSRGIGTNKDEIIKKAASAKRELDQKVADQTLSARKWKEKSMLIIGIVLLAIGFTGRISPHTDELKNWLRDLVESSDLIGKILLTVWSVRWFAKINSSNPMRWEKKNVLITGIVFLFIGFVFAIIQHNAKVEPELVYFPGLPGQAGKWIDLSGLPDEGATDIVSRIWRQAPAMLALTTGVFLIVMWGRKKVSAKYAKWSEVRKNEAAAISIKTMKELNKELNEKVWYRLLKVLWVAAYIFLLILLFSKSPATKNFTEAIVGFAAITVFYLGATVALKRAVCYAADYITTGKIYLKEKWHSLLFIALWGIPSIIAIWIILGDVFNGRRF